MNILAGREHSYFELRQKLRQKLNRRQSKKDAGSESEEHDFEQKEELIDEVLEQLVQENLLDDQRFTESFIRSRISRGSGPIKIRHELTEKGVASDLIDDYLDDSFEFWQETIEAVRCKRFGEQYPEDYKEQTKQSRFLYQRGFGSELIRRLFNNLE